MSEVPVHELPAIDPDILRQGGVPTADDVTILRDGTRLDTPPKLIAYLERFKAEMAASDGDLRAERS